MTDDDRFFAMLPDESRFRRAIDQFNHLNSADPNQELVLGKPRPRELANAERLSRWVMTLQPLASEELRLASRCQHLCRWTIPRDRFPLTRAGYHQWRNHLRQFHADKSAEVLRSAGYPEEMVARVRDLNLKKNFPDDPNSRVLEDALCLVFLQYQFAELAAKTDDAKVINALRKSWNKMTEQARGFALELDLGPRERMLLDQALRG